MSDSGTIGPHQGDDTAIGAALRRWAGDARFGARLASDAGVFLVLDASGRCIRFASAGARALAAAVSGPDARLAPALRIADQLGLPRLVIDRPILARIRFDQRGIAVPETCTLVRTTLADGEVVLILALVGLPPRLRALTPERAAPADATAAEGAPRAVAPAESSPFSGGTAPQRFVWRSDAAGILTEIAGPASAALRDIVIARAWSALSESGILIDAEGLLSALSQRRTFRAIPVTLMRPGADGPVDLELSGAPLDRMGGGFGGFGLVRSSASVPPSPDVPARPEPEITTIAEALAPVAPIVPVSDAAPDETEMWANDAALDEAPRPAEAALPDPHLSSNEHDAFREIARALGARFAGDEAPMPRDSDAVDGETERACAVMPFPAQPPRPVEAAIVEPDAAVIATLARLPTGVLVYRGDTILFANGPLLDLLGFEDLSALAVSGGVGRLFRGLLPHERTDADTPAVLFTRDGTSLAVDIQHSAIDWAGAPAELLLARDAAPGDALRQHAATAIAQDFAHRSGTAALAALDVIDDGVAILDANGRIISLNRGGAAILQLDPREVVGASFLSLFASESAIDVLAILHGVPGPAPGTPQEVHEVPARSRSGGRPLQIRVFPINDMDERRACAVIRDVAAARKAESEAVNARRIADAANGQKSDFLAKVSHEIRTPIGGILGLTDLMLAEQHGPVGGERYRDYLGDIRAAGAHVLDLVDDLLDLARIEAGRLDLTVTEIPLNEIVSRCVALLQPQAARDRIVVRTSFSEDLATLMADERSVRQAALNVIANAIAFTEAGGQVIVSTTMADRGEIALRVRDTGIGMTPDEVEIALEPFRQVDASGSRKGTGLGLPLTKALVEANHGRFRISSRKNEGTLVEMLFPVIAAAKSA
ncbi:PAS domain-containing protein [Methylobacterium sp. BTF04]|uniref:ATP-binding protein n=1 Tax=Methylobacterium sp. BTF04 TaxID=2708300 RepID=UPI0013D08051|nr:ATP-binding protein [Methylobacterium sp. BTF04]NEU10973.1 PAS domain-containing protein [Methylobacterium sp. BTF04]